MQEVGDIYEDMLNLHLPGKETEIPFYSTVTGQKSITQLGPAYWRSNFESPVLFNGAVKALLDDSQNENTFLEIGPHSALKGPLRDILKQHNGGIALDYIPITIRNSNSAASILDAIGELYVRGCAIDFLFLNAPALLLTDLPNYPWDHDCEYWKESYISNTWRMKKHVHHELLGSRCLESSEIEPSWRNPLVVYDVSWLSDHKVGNDIIFPCAGYIAMIGEAIRQVSSSEVYVLQNLVVKAAVILQDSGMTEIMTTMRPSRLTDSDNSSWYDFSISSFNRTSWIQHCVAQGKPGSGSETSSEKRIVTPYTRRLSQGFWYERLRYLGLNYGPNFQGMKEISAHVNERRATASLQNNTNLKEAKYSVHPTTLDNCLQLFTVAMTSGVARRLQTLALPSTVDCICVRPGGSDLLAEATTEISSKGVVSGDLIAVTRMNEPVITLNNGTFTPFVTGDRKEGTVHAAARLEWRPHIDFVTADKLIRNVTNKRDLIVALDNCTALCILRTLRNLESIDISIPHLVKFASWLRAEKESMARGNWVGKDVQQFVLLEGASYDAQLGLVEKELQASGNEAAIQVAQLMRNISDNENIQAVFSGRITPIEVLTKEGLLGAVYKVDEGAVNADDFFLHCAHAQPTLRVLETGVGTGGYTEHILKALVSKDGMRLYSEYSFTDISSGFFVDAKERFKDYNGIRYSVLDITKDPAEQGFELNSYDLIVASNVSISRSHIHRR